MSLPSEGVAAVGAGHQMSAGLPVRWMDARALKKEVSRLEFLMVGHENADTKAVETEDAQADADLCAQEADVADETSVVENIAAQIEAAKQEARREAGEVWERESEKRVANERTAVLRVCEQFNLERARYFACVEPEVVKLALAIAAQVLHREVKLDPLLLAAVVRVALEKVADGSSVVARVPSEDLARWREAFGRAQKPDVELIADERLERGECVLETSVGSVDVGVEAQLAEIERGFFDLLQKRP